jgi:hypothetical protein
MGGLLGRRRGGDDDDWVLLLSSVGNCDEETTSKNVARSNQTRAIFLAMVILLLGREQQGFNGWCLSPV